MTIDITDSLLTLEIKGVVLYTCKLQKFDFNVNIKDLKKHPNLPEWLETPFRLAWEKSSIPKVPLKIIQAPKDSIEAQYVISKILNSEELEDIQYSLHFDRNFRIDISQFQMETISEKQYSNLFLDDKSIDILGRVFSPKNIPSPSEELRMAVYLPQSDARTIYRALPKHASLAVRF
jgi:hypothetical protein